MSDRSVAIHLVPCAIPAMLCLALTVGVAAPAWAGPFGFVANKDSNDVTVVDTWTRTVKATLATSPLPLDLAASPDGAMLYVATDRHLDVIDLRTLVRTPVPYLSGLDDGNAIVVHPDGRTAWVSHGGASFMSEIDLTTNRATSVGVPVFGVHRVAISDSGDWIFGVSGAGDVFQLETATGLSTMLFTGAFPFPTGIAVNELDEVLVASDANLTVEKFEVTGFGVVGPRQVMASGFRPGGLANGWIVGDAFVARPFDGDVFDTYTGSSLSLPPGAVPFDVAGHDDSFSWMTANLGDVTGQAPPGGGSISFLTAGGVSTSVPAGLTPVAATIASERGEDVMGDPEPVEFAYFKPGGTGRRTVDVVSVGDDDAIVSDVTIVGPDAAAFQVIANGCSLAWLDYQQRCTVDVGFTAIPKPAPWYAKFIHGYLPSYTAQLAVDIGGETPVLIPLSAGPFEYRVKEEVKSVAQSVPPLSFVVPGD